MAKYVLHPGWIFKNTQRAVWISFTKLIELYGLDREDCTEASAKDCFHAGTDGDGMIHLFPNENGIYKI